MNVTAATYMPIANTDVDTSRFQLGASPDEVAQSLESVFASMLLKEMRNTLSDGLFGGERSDIFGGLFDTHLGEALTAGQGLGIKQLVVANLERMASPSASRADVTTR